MKAIEQAVRDIGEALKLLALQMSHRGWRHASAEFRIADYGTPAIRLRACEDRDGAPFHSSSWRWSWELVEGPTLASVLYKAHLAIAAMDEHPTQVLTRELAPYFTLSQSGEAALPLVPAPDGGDGSSSLTVAATPSASPARSPAEVGDDDLATVSNEAVVVDFPKRAS